MPDIFEKAREAVDRIWDYNERQLKEGVRKQDIDRARAEVDAIDDALLTTPDLDDMKTLLSMTVREAEKEFDYQDKPKDAPFTGGGNFGDDDFAAIDKLSLADIRHMVGDVDEDAEIDELSREDGPEEVEEETEEIEEEETEEDSGEEEIDEEALEKEEKKRRQKEAFEKKKKRQAEQRKKQEEYDVANKASSYISEATAGTYTYGGFNEEQEKLREAEMAKRQAEQDELIRRNEELAKEAQRRARNEQEGLVENYKADEAAETSSPQTQRYTEERNSKGVREDHHSRAEYEQAAQNDAYKGSSQQQYEPYTGASGDTNRIKGAAERFGAGRQDYRTDYSKTDYGKSPFEPHERNEDAVNGERIESGIDYQHSNSRSPEQHSYSQQNTNSKDDIISDPFSKPLNEHSRFSRTHHDKDVSANETGNAYSHIDETSQPHETDNRQSQKNDYYEQYDAPQEKNGRFGTTKTSEKYSSIHKTDSGHTETRKYGVDYNGSLNETYGDHFRGVVNGNDSAHSYESHRETAHSGLHNDDITSDPFSIPLNERTGHVGINRDENAPINETGQKPSTPNRMSQTDRANTQNGENHNDEIYSKFKEDQVQAREDDYAAAQHERQQKQNKYVSGLADEARETKRSADAFTEGHHSSLNRNNEAIDSRKTTIETVEYGSSDAPKSGQSSQSLYGRDSKPSSTILHAERAAEAREAEKRPKESAGTAYGNNVKENFGVRNNGTGADGRKSGNVSNEERAKTFANRFGPGRLYKAPAEAAKDVSDAGVFAKDEGLSSTQVHAKRVAEARQSEKALSQGSSYGDAVKQNLGVRGPKVIGTGASVKGNDSRIISTNPPQEKKSLGIRILSMPAKAVGAVAYAVQGPMGLIRKDSGVETLEGVVPKSNSQAESVILVNGKPVRVSGQSIQGMKEPARTAPGMGDSKLSADGKPIAEKNIGVFGMRTKQFDKDGNYVELQKDGSTRVITSYDEIQNRRKDKSVQSQIGKNADKFDRGKKTIRNADELTEEVLEKAPRVKGVPTGFGKGGKDVPSQELKEGIEKEGKKAATPFEYAMGTTYASKIRRAGGSAFVIVGKGVAEAGRILKRDTYDKTLAGQGLNKASRDTKKYISYADGAIAIVGATTALASGAGILGRVGVSNMAEKTGIKTAVKKGWAHFKGEDASKDIKRLKDKIEKEMPVKKGTNMISLGKKKSEARFASLKAELGSKFDKNGKIVSKGLLDKYLKVDKNGKQFLDMDLVNSDLKSMQKMLASGKVSAKDLVDFKNLQRIQTVGVSMKLSEKFAGVKRSLQKGIRASGRINRSIITYMGASNNVMGKGLAITYTTATVALSTVKATYGTLKWIHGTKPVSFVRDHTIVPAGKFVANHTFVPAGKAVGGAAKKAGEAAGRKLKSAATSSSELVAEKLKATKAGNIAVEAKRKAVEKIKKGFGGGIYNAVKDSKIGKAGKILGKGAEKVGGVAAKSVGVVGKVVKFATKPIDFAKTVAIQGPMFVIRKVNRLIWEALPPHVKMVILIALGCIIGFIALATIIGVGMTTLHNTIDTETVNLQRYVDYAVEQSQEWYKGKLPDSKVDIDGKQKSLNDVYEKGGEKTDRYRIITTRYVDQYGREVESSDNIKEILAMVAVKTQNQWPDNWIDLSALFGGTKWTVGDVQKIIKHLYAASHTWEAKEKGPYVYYKEINKKKVKLLKPENSYNYKFSYPSSDYMYEILTGDADEEACRGPRKFKCNETYEESGDLGEYYSQYRRKMIESYKARGGCEVDYSGYGTYNSATDKIELDGKLHNGDKTIKEAAQQIWATESMKNRYNTAQENKYAKENGVRITVGTDTNAYIVDGEGDDIKFAHGLTASTRTVRDAETAPRGWVHYDQTFSKYAHGNRSTGYMGTEPDPFCSPGEYRTVYDHTNITNTYGLPIYSGFDTYSQVAMYENGTWWAEFRWDENNYRYNSVKTYQMNGMNYMKVITSGAWAYNSATWNTTLWYRYDSANNKWIPHDGTDYEDVYNYYCTKQLYNFTCHDYEAYCNGHRTRVVIYYCPGHEEWYCDCNHYDLDIDITVLHFKVNALFKEDAENEYTYPRKAVAVGDYPKGFDKLEENRDSDFYWDYENREHAKGLANSKWTELYDGINGVDDVDVELVSEDLLTYLEYIDCKHIVRWETINNVYTPFGINGNAIEFAYAGMGTYSTTTSTGQMWLYDETRKCYVKVKETRIMGSVGETYKKYEIIQTRPTSPSAVSPARRRFIELALQCVGKIPYADLDTAASGKTMLEPTLSLAQKTEITVNGEEVTLNLDKAFAYGKDAETGETNYDDYEYGLDSGGFVNYVLCLLDKSFHTSEYHLDYTHEIKKMWEGKTTLIGTRKTIKEEDLLPGDIGFINGYGTNNFDNRKNDYEEALQSDDDLMPFNTVGIYLGTNNLGEKVWIQCSKSSQTVAVTTSNAFNYFRRVDSLGDK